MPNDIANNMVSTINYLEEQNKELKRLLKEAIKDIGDLSRYCLGVSCDRCPHIRTLDRGHQSCIWQHEAETLALIDEDINVNTKEDGEANG